MRDTILAWSNYDYFLVSKANFAFCCQFQDSCMARLSFLSKKPFEWSSFKKYETPLKTSGNPKRWVGSPWNGSAFPRLWSQVGIFGRLGRHRPGKGFCFIVASISGSAGVVCKALIVHRGRRMPGDSGKDDTGSANNLGKLFRWKIQKIIFFFIPWNPPESLILIPSSWWWEEASCRPREIGVDCQRSWLRCPRSCRSVAHQVSKRGLGNKLTIW